MKATSRDETGSVVAFVVLLVSCLMALAGLASEGGAVLSAREAAVAEAEQAARTGAADASALALHDGRILDAGAAPLLAAEAVMAADGHPGTASLGVGSVTAVIDPFVVATPLLALAGVPSIVVTARATARAVTG